MSKRVSNKPSKYMGARSGRTSRVARRRQFIDRERKRIRAKYAEQLQQHYETKPVPTPTTIMEYAKRLFRRRMP